MSSPIVHKRRHPQQQAVIAVAAAETLAALGASMLPGRQLRHCPHEQHPSVLRTSAFLHPAAWAIVRALSLRRYLVQDLIAAGSRPAPVIFALTGCRQISSKLHTHIRGRSHGLADRPCTVPLLQQSPCAPTWSPCGIRSPGSRVV